jgi:hypothetical protein
MVERFIAPVAAGRGGARDPRSVVGDRRSEATGARKARPDDRRRDAIHRATKEAWIASWHVPLAMTEECRNDGGILTGGLPEAGTDSLRVMASHRVARMRAR